MKKIIVLSFLGIALSSFSLFEVNIFDFHHLFERCEGSDYCTICTNCKRCGYCKGGGTCSVCYTPRLLVRKSPSKKTYRTATSVSPNNAYSINSGSPAVKRYYLRKSSARKYSSSAISAPVDQPETESFSTKDETDLNVKSNNSSKTKTALADDMQPIYSTPNSQGEKESFTVDIPENADFVRVTASSAHLREQSNTKSTILQTLNHGDLLIKLKSVRGWVKVQALDSGEIGYVSRILIE